MTDAAYRLAVNAAMMSHAARATAAMAHHFRSHPVRARNLTAAMVARMQALGRLSAGLGVATLHRAVGRSAPYRGEQEGIASCRTSYFPQRGAAEATRRSTMAGNALLASAIVPAGMRRMMPATRTASAALGAKATGVGDNPFAGPRLAQFTLAKHGPRRTGALTRRGTGGASAAIVGVGPRLAAPHGPPLAVRTLTRIDTPRHAASLTTPTVSARARHHIAVPSPQQATAPGFHRTVRQARSKAAAGDVYLDKALVGYHLAAAITAEQTRAAARPNISGSSFNSSMAALRPSGAGL